MSSSPDDGNDTLSSAQTQRAAEVVALLETQAASAAATIQDRIAQTIIPPHGKASTTARRALEALRGLAPNPMSSQGSHLVMGETIGSGGMGIVRSGEQVALGRQVAIKTLRTERRTDVNTLELLQEAWVTGALEHPNVLPVYDLALDEDGTPLVVLKRIEGVTWGALMHDGVAISSRFGADDLLAWNLGILDQVANAARFAHSRGILHRDIKPENVMIGGFGEVYLMDWGIAVSLRDDRSGRLPLAANATSVAGTPAYMAPEMLTGEPHRLSERTDIYLMGATLYQILTGGPPHFGEDLSEIVGRVLASTPVFPDDAPSGLVAVCRQAMAADPKARFADVESLQKALHAFLRNRGAERLVQQAQKLRSELEARVQRAAEAEAKRSTVQEGEEADDAGDDEERRGIYALFGQCRFGYHEALSTWPEHEEAGAGLRGAIETMATYELSRGDARAAASFLAELTTPTPALREQVDAALARDAEERRELATLRSREDPTIGRRTRLFLSTLFGAVWTTFPIGAHYISPETTYPKLLIGISVLLAFVAGLGWWARDSMSKTVLNQRMFAVAVFSLVATILLGAAGMVLGLPADTVTLLAPFIWFCTSSLMVFGVDLRFWPTVFGYLVAFFVAASRPELRFFAMGGGNLVLTINVLLIWGNHPRQLWGDAYVRADRPRSKKRTSDG